MSCFTINSRYKIRHDLVSNLIDWMDDRCPPIISNTCSVDQNLQITNPTDLWVLLIMTITDWKMLKPDFYPASCFFLFFSLLLLLSMLKSSLSSFQIYVRPIGSGYKTKWTSNEPEIDTTQRCIELAISVEEQRKKLKKDMRLFYF